MLFNDLVKIGLINIAIPSRFWINDYDWSFATAVHTAGGVDSDLVGNSRAKLLDALLDVIAGFLRITLLTALRSV